eukprot:TRINITY_DN1540_c0_g1_i24.p1 TRINITY_DN1540_c0_g1~~TRINITY_DN1540_c0_g1_i24.p1  ORF type:complete len:454 (-),score=79.97 TRINITY_DN1540_c0_g1_i24:306-1667(-)
MKYIFGTSTSNSLICKVVEISAVQAVGYCTQSPPPFEYVSTVRLSPAKDFGQPDSKFYLFNESAQMVNLFKLGDLLCIHSPGLPQGFNLSDPEYFCDQGTCLFVFPREMTLRKPVDTNTSWIYSVAHKNDDGTFDCTFVKKRIKISDIYKNLLNLTFIARYFFRSHTTFPSLFLHFGLPLPSSPSSLPSLSSLLSLFPVCSPSNPFPLPWLPTPVLFSRIQKIQKLGAGEVLLTVSDGDEDQDTINVLVKGSIVKEVLRMRKNMIVMLVGVSSGVIHFESEHALGTKLGKVRREVSCDSNTVKSASICQLSSLKGILTSDFFKNQRVGDEINFICKVTVTGFDLSSPHIIPIHSVCHRKLHKEGGRMACKFCRVSGIVDGPVSYHQVPSSSTFHKLYNYNILWKLQNSGSSGSCLLESPKVLWATTSRNLNQYWSLKGNYWMFTRRFYAAERI